MAFQKKYVIGIMAALIAAILDFYFLYGQKIFYFILVLSGIMGFVPFLFSIILGRNKEREIESRFLEFTRDLVENVRSGTPISKSIINLRTRNYGELSFYVEKLANQISLGIPLGDALNTFARDTQSPVISRAINLISEAERAGGQIDSILESVSNSVNKTEELKKQRKSAVYNLAVQGYIIFIIFIIIMIVLEFKILPMIPPGDSIQGLSVSVKNINPAQFSMPLLILLLVQAFFSGLVIGKISEGSLRDGIKHSFILIALALLIKTGVTAFLG